MSYSYAPVSVFEARDSSTSPVSEGEREAENPTEFICTAMHETRDAATSVRGDIRVGAELNYDTLLQILYFTDEKTIMKMRLSNSSIKEEIDNHRTKFRRMEAEMVRITSSVLLSDPVLLDLILPDKSDENHLTEKNVLNYESLLRHFIPREFKYTVLFSRSPDQIEDKTIPNFPIPKEWFNEIFSVTLKVKPERMDVLLPIMGMFPNLKQLKLNGITGPGKISQILELMPAVWSFHVEAATDNETNAKITADDNDLATVMAKGNSLQVFSLKNIDNKFSTEALIKFLEEAYLTNWSTIRLQNWPSDPARLIQWLKRNTKITETMKIAHNNINLGLFHPNQFEFEYRTLELTLFFYSHCLIRPAN